MLSLTLLVAALTAVDAVMDWTCIWLDRRRIHYLTKPLVMVGLIAVTVLASDGEPSAWWLVVALFFGMLGDISMIGASMRRLLGGMATFLVGHVAYVLAFVSLGLPAPAWSWAVVAVLLVTMVPTRRIVAGAHQLGGRPMAAAVSAYTLVIAAMLVVGWLTGSVWIAAGALVFVISDMVIGLNLAEHGNRPPRLANVTIMVTYHVGQALIVAGVLLALP